MSPVLVVAGVSVAAACWWALPARPERPARGSPPVAAAWLAAPLLLLVLPPAVLVGGVVVTGGGQRLWALRRARRRAAATGAGVLEAVELVAAEVSAGAPPALALRHATEAWPPLEAAAATASLGGEVPEVLRRLACDPGADRLRVVAAAWEVAHRSGGGLADALTRVGEGLRDDRATARVVEGELASARATARLVAALPLFAVLVSSTTGSGGAWTFVTTEPLGWACLVGGLLLGLAGLTWIERIAAGVHR